MVISGLRNGDVLQLNPTAAVLWQALSSWTTETDLSSLLERLYPEVDVDERAAALAEALEVFAKEELLEFGPT